MVGRQHDHHLVVGPIDRGLGQRDRGRGVAADRLIDRGNVRELAATQVGVAPALEVCALLTKPARREIDVPVRWIGFEIPNRFVIGYGLDFAERYRNLPYVGVLSEELIGGVCDERLGLRARPRGNLAATLGGRKARESLLP